MRYRMWSLSPTPPCSCMDTLKRMRRPGEPHVAACGFTDTWAWRPMDEGPGKSAWKPRATAQDAAFRCLQWTGLLGIPAMRVTDADGTVVWQYEWTGRDPRRVEDVLPEWHEQVMQSVQDAFDRDREASERSAAEVLAQEPLF